MIIYEGKFYKVVIEDLEKVLKEIIEKSNKEKIRILIQLPDGLKPFFDKIYFFIKEKFKNVEVWFWFDSNYGACDYPFYFKELNFDYLIHIGHSDLFYRISKN